MSDVSIGANLPGTWVQRKMGTLVSSPQYGWTSAAASTGQVRLLRTTDVTRGPIDWDHVPFCRDEPSELAKFQLHPGDVVVSRAGSVGVSALVDEVPCKAVFASYLIRLRCIESILPKYLKYFLQSPSYWLQVEAMSAGITLKNINASKLKELTVPLCSITEQERIVEILEEQLSRLDAAVKSVQTVREKAAQFRRSLLHAAFSGELLESHSRGTNGPTGVTWKALSQLGDEGVFVDGDWVESKDQDPNGDIRLTQLADVGEGQFRDRSNRYLRKDQAERLGVTYLHEGDLLIARMPDPLGRCCQVPKLDSPAVTVVDVAILRVNQSDVNPRYLMWILNSPSIRQEMIERSSGTTRTRISRRNLGGIQVPLPPASEQQETVEVLEEQLTRLEATLAVADEVERKANAFRRSLLHAAFTGELTRSWREAHV